LAFAGPVDVVAGGPPCQGWSIQRRGGTAVDERNDLTVQFVAIAVALRPKAIVMENVPTILGKRGAQHLRLVDQMLDDAGYSTSKDVVDAAWYGVPQFRRRAVVVGIRRDLGAEFRLPSPSHRPNAYRTVRDAIGDLPS